MTSSIATRLRGFLRRLRGHPEPPVALAAGAAPATPAPVVSRAVPAAASPPAAAPPPAAGLELELPLAAVVAGLPPELKASLAAPPAPNRTISVQTEMVIGQLPYGAVKISFGELRRQAPECFSNSGRERDNQLISLPMQEILPRLNPAFLARRLSRKVDVADSIAGPFAERGRGLSFTTRPLKGAVAVPAAPIPTTPVSEPVSPPPLAPIPPAADRIERPPASSPLPARAVTPAPPRPSTVTPPPPARAVPPSAPGNGAPAGNLPLPGSSPKSSPAPETPGLRFNPLPSRGQGTSNLSGTPPTAGSPAPVAQPASRPATPAPPSIAVLLGDLCGQWPDDLKEQLLGSALAQVRVPLEIAAVLPGMQRGRLVMTWRQLRLLAQPDSAPSPHDALELELPLKVIAPIFLTAQKNLAQHQAKTQVSAEIPDLFFGFPRPEAAPAATAPAPDAGQVRGPAAEAEPGRGQSGQTDFLSRRAHPKEVVVLAAALPGVAGAVVALQDGTPVASQVPSEFHADTLAAFLPQIMERVNQCTRQLRMGALNQVNFMVGDVAWEIFRVNAGYFAAFAQPGNTLPVAELVQLAAQLERKK